MKFWQVDAFTEKPFTGNPAAVVILKEDISDELKQNIAMEMNVSETAFLLISEDRIEIRWFTPNAEVNLCGHATLASAHVLWNEGIIQTDKLTFQSKSGLLGVSRDRCRYTLDFPKQEPVEKLVHADLIAEILGVTPVYIGSNGEDCAAVIEDTELLKRIKPDLEKIQQLPERGFLLTAIDESGTYDYLYRGFFPKLDIPEDPVTGSANTLLAPYWSEQLDKTHLTAYQASARGGKLSLEVNDNRVLIGGNAITVITGEIHLEEGR